MRSSIRFDRCCRLDISFVISVACNMPDRNLNFWPFMKTMTSSASLSFGTFVKTWRIRAEPAVFSAYSSVFQNLEKGASSYFLTAMERNCDSPLRFRMGEDVMASRHPLQYETFFSRIVMTF
jgi:hypothetical protein